MADEGFQRRAPAVYRKVSEIQPDDIRVSIIGMIVDKDEKTLIIDDGTGKILANFTEDVKVETNKLARVFGRVLPSEDGVILQGEIVQDMSGLDSELFKKVMDITQKKEEPEKD